MRVVLDTNVIVSGLNFPGNERIVLDLARRGRFELCLSPFILEEVSGVLGRKFGWSEGRSTQPSFDAAGRELGVPFRFVQSSGPAIMGLGRDTEWAIRHRE